MANILHHETVIILDFGSQYTQLIARRVREAGVYCEILPFDTSLAEIKTRTPKGLILSGGPSSVYDKDSPKPQPKLLQSVDCPVLGICYGLHVFAGELGGSVEASHVTAVTDDALNAMEDETRQIFAVQFHPEVAHTPLGAQVIRNFLFAVCGCRGDWSPEAVIEEQISRIRDQLGSEGRVVSGLSGGVDSTVASALVHRAVGDRQTCIFVDNGLLREGEFESTLALLAQSMKLNVTGVRASQAFLKTLEGVTDPEEKRKRIGKVFIDVFEQEARRLGRVEYLVQGTLYPDVIESVSVRGPSAVIKSHHNVGGLPEKMNLRLIEPLRELFKDEVRLIGRELGVPEEILGRHPFPGPGLAVRILGEVTEERIRLLQAADRILDEELRLADLYNSVWQAFPVLLPVSTVGVMGDERTYERVIAIRAVTSVDGMTADWARLPQDLLGESSCLRYQFETAFNN